MKRIEWVVVFLLIIIGVSCLTMSATAMNPVSTPMYLGNFMRICMWIGMPAMIAALSYLLFKWVKGNKDDC